MDGRRISAPFGAGTASRHPKCTRCKGVLSTRACAGWISPFRPITAGAADVTMTVLNPHGRGMT